MRERLRVGIIANSYDPVFGDRAGGHVHMIQVAKRWKNFDLVVFAPETARRVFARDLPGAQFAALPSCEAITTNKLAVFLYRSLAWAAASKTLRNCDVLFCLSQFLPDVVPAVCVKPRRSTVVLWHLLEPPWKREGPVLVNYIAYTAERLGTALVELFFRCVIVGSRLLEKQMRLHGRKRYYITTNGTEHVRPPAVPDNLAPRRGAVFVGRLHPTKGVEDLIAAWAVAPELSSHRLTIAGGGSAEYEARLLRMVAEKGLADSIVFAGAVSDDVKRSLLETSAVFVFPSKEEGWGIAIAEAMAFGLPCVTYDLEIFREVFVRGRIGVPVGDVRELGRRVGELLNDENLRAFHAAQALQLARTFSWDTAARIEEDAVRSLAE